ncbi:hypothetical protein AFM11_03145 [Mycolicibacterium wolinskyi]|uniref:Uncharacterized protein n=1 Tax=Mycolicibacterium wolinskyi TaxID=59750 RepID=A0A132PSG8_9MYCO|nr:hypothetical protein AFM11_03145 [Mycolicibacterium wolinskyi]
MERARRCSHGFRPSHRGTVSVPTSAPMSPSSSRTGSPPWPWRRPSPDTDPRRIASGPGHSRQHHLRLTLNSRIVIPKPSSPTACPTVSSVRCQHIS